MTSVVDVANLALDLIGQPQVASLNNGDYRSDTVGRNFDLCRDRIHRTYPWRRLMSRQSLPKSVTPPAFGYSSQFPLPMDCLRLVEVYVNNYPLLSPWNIEGNSIMTDGDGPLQIRYIKKEPNPNNWDSELVFAVAYDLASVIANPLTKDMSKVQMAQQSLAQIMRHARANDAIENQPPRYNVHDSWITARYGAGGDYNSVVGGV